MTTTEDILEWLEENKKEGATIVGYKPSEPIKYGRNLIEVIIKMANEIKSPFEQLDFLTWAKNQVETSMLYVAPEIMGSEWQAVHNKLGQMFDGDIYQGVWDVWSGKR